MKFGNKKTNFFPKFTNLQIKNNHFPLNNTCFFENLCYLVEKILFS